MRAESPHSGSEPEAEQEYSQVLRKATRFLGTRAHSVSQLRDKLLRSFSPHSVERVLARLSETGFLDDLEFARQYARWRFKRSPRSSALVIAEIMKRGVEKDTAVEAVNAVMAEDDLQEETLAQVAAGKKLAALGGMAEPERKLKLIRFLSYRGFSETIARSAVERILKHT